MNRRVFLAITTGAVGGLSGCVGDLRAPQRAAAQDETETETEQIPQKSGDFTLPIPESELNRGAPKDGIPAITDPQFGDDWNDLEVEVRDGFSGVEYTSTPTLDDDEVVIGVERNGEARAYPLAVLNWHEIVNDEFDGPLLVTFCPLCGSGVTAERTVDGEETVFGVSGLLWNSDLVMYDAKTESLWSQILGQAIRGPKTGETLTLVPSSRTTWGEWKADYPETQVLLPPPISNTITGRTSRDYDRNPYASYENSSSIGIGYNDFDDDRLHPKALVVGVTSDGVARAYPFDAVKQARVVNDTVGSLPVVVATTPDGSLFAYDRRVDGKGLTFKRADDQHIVADGSTWRITTGRAATGPHSGTQLTRANDRSPMFWFAWADFHPDTEVYS